MEKLTKSLEKKDHTIWLMGDFNSLDNVKQEGYELICKSGWKDSYCLAEQKDSGVTVEEEIDGWRDGEGGGAVKDANVWITFSVIRRKSKVIEVVCNGKNYPVVSDHYGVMIEVED